MWPSSCAHLSCALAWLEPARARPRVDRSGAPLAPGSLWEIAGFLCEEPGRGSGHSPAHSHPPPSPAPLFQVPASPDSFVIQFPSLISPQLTYFRQSWGNERCCHMSSEGDENSLSVFLSRMEMRTASSVLGTPGSPHWVTSFL